MPDSALRTAPRGKLWRPERPMARRACPVTSADEIVSLGFLMARVSPGAYRLRRDPPAPLRRRYRDSYLRGQRPVCLRGCCRSRLPTCPAEPRCRARRARRARRDRWCSQCPCGCRGSRRALSPAAGAPGSRIIRRGCLVHAAPATWEWHPRRIPWRWRVTANFRRTGIRYFVLAYLSGAR